MSAEKKSFLGTGWSFPPTFNHKRKTVEMVTEDDDIQQSLFLLIGTIPGERILRPIYGCDLHSQVFERLSSRTRLRITDLITKAIKKSEPRIILENIDIQWSKEDVGIIFIQIEYTIIQTNSRSNMVYPFYLEEGTNLPLRIHSN